MNMTLWEFRQWIESNTPIWVLPLVFLFTALVVSFIGMKSGD